MCVFVSECECELLCECVSVCGGGGVRVGYGGVF